MDTLDLIHPTLRPLVNAFLMKSKYPYKIEAAGRTIDVRDGEDFKMYSLRVNFFDPNYTHSAVGSLKFVVKIDGGFTFSARCGGSLFMDHMNPYRSGGGVFNQHIG